MTIDTIFLIISVAINILVVLGGSIAWILGYFDNKTKASNKEELNLATFTKEQTKLLIDKISDDLDKVEVKLGKAEGELHTQDSLLNKYKQKSDEIFLTILYVHREVQEAIDLIRKIKETIVEEHIESEAINRRLKSLSEVVNSISGRTTFTEPPR